MAHVATDAIAAEAGEAANMRIAGIEPERLDRGAGVGDAGSPCGASAIEGKAVVRRPGLQVSE